MSDKANETTTQTGSGNGPTGEGNPVQAIHAENIESLDDIAEPISDPPADPPTE